MNVLVNVDVDDLGKGVVFYCDGLGLSFVRYLFDGTVAELTAGSLRLMLLLKPEDSAPAGEVIARRNYARHWTPVHLDFEVDDIETARERALAAGAVAESAITTAPWGRLALMSDPFGHGFCLVQLSARGYDLVT